MGYPIQPDNKAGRAARWSECEPEARARNVVGIIDWLRSDQSQRASRAQRNLETYLGRTAGELSDGDLGTPAGDDGRKLTLRVGQSVCDTAKAKIAAKQRPLCAVMTDGADYGTRRRARKTTDYLEGLMHLPHGGFPNLWELTEQVFADGTWWEAGVCKVVADPTNSRPMVERRVAQHIFFDHHDAKMGNPQNLFEIVPFDRLVLSERFPGKRDAIMNAELFPFDDHHNNATRGDMVAVYESYRLPMGDKPGRHVIAIKHGNDSGVALVDEEWSRPEFPHVFFRWEPHAFGVWGNPLIEQIEETQRQANDSYEFLNEKVMANSTTMIEFDPEVYDEQDLQANDAVVLIPKKGPEGSLRVHSPPPFHPAMFQFMQYQYSQNFELPGVSEMGAQGRAPAGVTAGVAMRTVNALSTERFLPKSRAYEGMFPAIGKRMLWVMEDLAKAHEGDSEEMREKLSVHVPTDENMKPITWDEVELESWTVRLAPASSLPDTPAARLELVTEFAQAGYISQEAAKRLLAQTAPDIDAMGRREAGQHRYLERIVADVQDYAEELSTAEEKGGNALDDVDPLTIPQPDPLLDLEAAVVQMTLAYREMLADDAPEEAARLIRNWVAEAIEVIQARQAPPAGGAMDSPLLDPASAGGAVPLPPGDPGMMPPGAPPMPMPPMPQ